MWSALAGVFYALAVFAAGIVVALVRIGFVQPELGPTFGLVLELPVMIAFSWFVSQEIARYRHTALDIAARVAMGVVAFLVLMICEFVLANVLFQNSLASFVKSLVTWPGILGFLGQIVFAAIPALQQVLGRKPVEPR